MRVKTLNVSIIYVFYKLGYIFIRVLALLCLRCDYETAHVPSYRLHLQGLACGAQLRLYSLAAQMNFLLPFVFRCILPDRSLGSSVRSEWLRS